MSTAIPMTKGQQSETNVAMVLQKLQREGIIAGFEQSKFNDSNDRKGIDFTINLMIGDLKASMPLQVKSSQWGVDKHQDETRNRDKIPVVNGQSESLYNDILAVIKAFKNPGESDPKTMSRQEAGKKGGHHKKVEAAIDKQYRMPFVKRFRKWRIDNDLSLIDAGELMETNSAQICHFERGTFSTNHRLYAKAADLMNVPHPRPVSDAPELPPNISGKVLEVKPEPVQVAKTEAPKPEPNPLAIGPKKEQASPDSVKQAVDSLKAETAALESEISRMVDDLAKKRQSLATKQSNLSQLSQAWETVRRIMGGL